MKVMGLQGISTAAEYGAKDVSELRDYLVDNNIKAVFVESSVPAKAMEAIIAGAAEKAIRSALAGNSSRMPWVLKEQKKVPILA